MVKMRIFTVFVLLLLSYVLRAQQPYFVDGYHGGVYGHYPMWVTSFMLDKLAAHPEWRLGLEIEPETWDTVKQKEPEAYAQFVRIVNDRRIEFTNPTYAQPYGYNISGESMIRQFQFGMRKIREHFPDVTFTTYAVEEPCFTSSLPQLLKQFGFKYAVLKCPNTCWGGYTAGYGGELVNWVGPEGTSILSVPRYVSEALEENSTWQTTAWDNSTAFIQAAYNQGVESPVGMCYQDAGWKNGPWLGYGDKIKNKSTYVTWTEYVEKISSRQTEDNWHFSQEDIHVNLMWGSQALQHIAQDVRKSENKLAVAEKINAMAYLDNHYRPSVADEEEAWRTLMLAQHHDSWIVPYNQLNKGQTWEQAVRSWTDTTNGLAEKMIQDAISGYVKHTPSGGEDLGYIRVFNTVVGNRSETVRVELPSTWEQRDISVYDNSGKELPCILTEKEGALWIVFRPDAPDFGYTTYALRAGKHELKARKKRVHFDQQGNCVIENDMYKIKLDRSKGGVMTSLVAKYANHKEFVGQQENCGFGEISGHFYEEGKFHSSKDAEAKITVLEDNPFVVKVKVEGYIASHPVAQIITLEAGQQRIEVDLTVGWQGNVGIGEYKQEHDWTDNRRAYTDDRYKLKVLFPNNLQSTKLYKNAPFDVCESGLDNTFFGKWDEIKHNVILHWVDLLEESEEYGLALLSDHTTSYLHGADYPLGLTAQYSGIGLWGVDYKITQPLNMKYALIPHRGKWDEAAVSHQSACWNEPLLCAYFPVTALENKSLIAFADTGYQVSATQITDGGKISVRLFNADGDEIPQQVTFGMPLSDVQEVDLNGNVIERKAIRKHVEKTEMTVSMPRFAIRTFLLSVE